MRPTRRISAGLLALLLLPSLSGCRRKVLNESAAEEVLLETVFQTSPPKTTSSNQETEATESGKATEPTDFTETETEPPTEPSENTPTASSPQRPTNSTPKPAPNPTSPGNAERPDPTEPISAIEITVTLDANRGRCEKTSLTVRSGEAYGTLPAADREGFEFAGWYTLKNGGTKVEESTIVANAEAHTLHAHWNVRQTYAVTFDANEGRLSAEEAERTIYAGDTYGTLPIPTRRGYDFTGWFTEDGTQILAETVFTGSGNLTLYAHWDYNPYAYWSFVLQNTTEQVYACQQASVYLEFDADNITTAWCPLISATGSRNVAANVGDGNVTDDWVLANNPDVIVKCVSDMSIADAYYSAMAARFPGYRILVVPSSAVYGSASQILYYELYFGKLLYPDWYAEVDLGTVAAELGAGGSIYG